MLGKRAWKGALAAACLAVLAAGCEAEAPTTPTTGGFAEALGEQDRSADDASIDAPFEPASDAEGADAASGAHTPGQFDYYLLALSWSPSYCAQPGAAERDRLQCAGSRPFAFVVHGLWPQYERGWPQDCSTTHAADAPRGVEQGMLDIMPSPRLVQQQWDKHGRCDGDPPEAYFSRVRDFAERVRIPPDYRRLSQELTVTASEVEAAFLAANPGLSPDGIVVTCNRNRMREVRVCMAKDGAFRSCGGDVRERCGDRALTMAPVRGG